MRTGTGSHIAYYICFNLLTLFLLFQAINQAKIAYVETLHNSGFNSIIEAVIFSKDIDRLIASVLLLLLTVLQLLFILRTGVRSIASCLSISSTILSLFVFSLFQESVIPFFAVLFFNLFHIKTDFSFWKYINSTMILTALLSSLCLVRWLTYPFLKTDFYMDLSWIFPKVEKTLSYSLSAILSPLLATVFVLSWILSIVMIMVQRIKGLRIGGGKIEFSVGRNHEKARTGTMTDCKVDGKLSQYLFNPKVAILISSAFLLYLNYYAYFPSLNPLGKPVSVDILYNYVPALERFELMGLTPQGIAILFESPEVRPVVMLSLFVMKNLLYLSYIDTVKLSLFLSGLLLAFASYYSLKMATGNEILSAASIYFSTFSFQTVVGLYAGYLGMWIAASLELLTISFLSRAVDAEDFRKLIPAIFLSVLALLSHPWSWFLFTMAILALFPLNLLLSHIGIQRRYTKGQAAILAAFFLIHLIPEILRQTLFNSPSTISLIQGAFSWGTASVQNFLLFHLNLNYLLEQYVGGFFSNFLIYILSIGGAISALRHDGALFHFIFSSLVVVSPIFFICDYRVQCRILYFLPLQLISTLGLFDLLRASKGNLDVATSFSATMLPLMNYAFRSIANFV